MPSGPPELHEEWSNKGPHDGMGDLNAQSFLQSRGYRLTKRWEWIPPTPDHEPAPEENSAINYLCWEWDFGGLAPQVNDGQNNPQTL